jgi:hypothetical protein
MAAVDAIHSPTDHDPTAPFPLERCADAIWEIDQAVRVWCERKQDADSAEQYIAVANIFSAVESLMDAVERLAPPREQAPREQY